jgi:murein DD-endopeptidase MepM/ murein hydrolase activator NlpD
VPHPIPGFAITTPFAARGEHWSCDQQSGKGIHTGDDYSTSGQIGFDVLATAPGEVVIVSQGEGGWGSPYGKHVVIESDGVRHGYCHLSKVFVQVGQHVAAGRRIGLSGNTGNVAGSIGPFFGAHLHYEERSSPFSFCDVARKPSLSRGPGPGFTIPVGTVLLSRLELGVQDSDSVRRLQDVLNGIALTGRRLRVTGNYGKGTRREVKAWQVQVMQEPPDSPRATGSAVGPRQAKRLFARTGNSVVDDTGSEDG